MPSAGHIQTQHGQAQAASTPDGAVTGSPDWTAILTTDSV
jgi:hypothetical protein